MSHDWDILRENNMIKIVHDQFLDEIDGNIKAKLN